MYKDNTGFVRFVPFIDGKPVGQVPDGATEQGSSTSAPTSTNTQNQVVEGSKGDWEPPAQREISENPSYDIRDLSDEQLMSYYNQQKQYVDFLETPGGWATKMAVGKMLPGVGTALTSGLVQDRFIFGGLTNEMQKRGLMPSTGGIESGGKLTYRDSTGSIRPGTYQAMDTGAKANYEKDRSDNNPQTNFGGSASNFGKGTPVSQGGSGAHPSYEKSFGTSDVTGGGNSGDNKGEPSESDYGGDWGGGGGLSSGGLW
jgi:hypothetical protein